MFAEIKIELNWIEIELYTSHTSIKPGIPHLLLTFGLGDVFLTGIFHLSQIFFFVICHWYTSS